MPPPIEPNIDLYGTYARASAIADFLESQALSGQSWSRADVADYLDDSGSTMKTAREHYTSNEPPVEFDEYDLGEDGNEGTERIYGDISERRAILGDRYPFDTDAAGRMRARRGAENSPYAALLGITVAHAHGLLEHMAVENAFEEVVALAVGERLGCTVNFGALSRDATGFDAALIEAGNQVAIDAVPGAAVRNKNAQDEGVDVLTHLDWNRDKRPGRWILLGQATCSKSDSWAGKLAEVPRGRWQLWLSSQHPLAYLAVPHHVAAGKFESLASEGVVLDRLRLTPFLREVGPAQAAVDAMLSSG